MKRPFNTIAAAVQVQFDESESFVLPSACNAYSVNREWRGAEEERQGEVGVSVGQAARLVQVRKQA